LTAVKLTKAQRRIVRDDPVAAKLVAHVTQDHAGCWLWNALKPHAYGTIAIDGRPRRAHRASYEAFSGPIPPGFFVCHHCDVPACINPHHLFLGRATDNMRDMVRKGRAANPITSAQDHFKAGHAPRGSAASGARLSENEAKAALADMAAGMRILDIAAKYQRDRKTIQDLVNGRTWPDLDRSQIPASRKGRQAKGERVWTARLTEEQAMEIIASPLSTRKLAAIYGIGAAAIHKVKSGATWKHLHRSALQEASHD